MKKLIKILTLFCPLFLIISWGFLVFAAPSSSIKNVDLQELQQQLNSILTSQGISKAELDQKMRELSKNISLSPSQLQAPIQGLSERDQQELDSLVRQTLNNHGITKADLDQLNSHLQNTINSLQNP